MVLVFHCDVPATPLNLTFSFSTAELDKRALTPGPPRYPRWSLDEQAPMVSSSLTCLAPWFHCIACPRMIIHTSCNLEELTPHVLFFLCLLSLTNHARWQHKDAALSVMVQ